MKRGADAVRTPTPPKTPRPLLSTHTLLLSLLFSYVSALSSASPISVPDIANNKSGKNTGSTSSSAALVIKPSSQDAQLNSLNAYATNYGQFANNAAQTASTTGNGNSFKPSYKIPDLENNFTPIQTHSGVNIMPHAAPLTAVAPNANNIPQHNIPMATPVLMQYLPQAIPDGGVHYLQLIPTRPLIVPISLNGNAATSEPQPAATHALHPPLAAAINGGGPLDYAVRSPAILTPDNINGGALQQHQQQQQQHQQQLQQQQQLQLHPSPSAPLIDVSNAAQPYGMQTYANAIQPYRSSYRINREVKGKHFPGTMILNMNEYIPGPNDALRPLYMRGRP